MTNFISTSLFSVLISIAPALSQAEETKFSLNITRDNVEVYQMNAERLEGLEISESKKLNFTIKGNIDGEKMDVTGSDDGTTVVVAGLADGEQGKEEFPSRTGAQAGNTKITIGNQDRKLTWFDPASQKSVSASAQVKRQGGEIETLVVSTAELEKILKSVSGPLVEAFTLSLQLGVTRAQAAQSCAYMISKPYTCSSQAGTLTCNYSEQVNCKIRIN